MNKNFNNQSHNKQNKLQKSQFYQPKGQSDSQSSPSQSPRYPSLGWSDVQYTPFGGYEAKRRITSVEEEYRYDPATARPKFKLQYPPNFLAQKQSE